MSGSGSRIGSYVISAKIGEGGMGAVFQAKDSQLGREVALKVLPEKFNRDPERVARFEREAKLLAALNHPNIAQIYGLETSGDTRALVMELVRGPTLAERLSSGPLPLEESLSIAHQIAEALEQAHEKGIVHRDLKPSNIKVDAEGKVKVLDFGLAKAYSSDAETLAPSDLSRSPTLGLGNTQAGVILGTAAYMAPEQARGRKVDKQADIWAFGVVLFEMLTGARLFAADSVADSLAAVLTRELDWSALPAATPPSIRRLLRRAIERNPKNRLHDIADARLVIDDVLTGGGEEPLARAQRTRFGGSGLLPLVLLPLAAVFLTLLVVVGREPLLPEPVRLRRLTFSAYDHQPSASPDGRFVAFVSNREGPSRIWLKQMQGGGEERLTEGPDTRPRFAPDGNAVGFLREIEPGRNDLYRTALLGGQPRRLVADVSDFDWSPEGRSVAFVRQREGASGADVSVLGVVELEGEARQQELLEVAGWSLLGPRFSPDGERIAVTQGGAFNSTGQWKLLLVDPATGAREELDANEGQGMISSTAWDSKGRGLFYAAAPQSMGDMTGAPAAVRWLVPGATPRTLFWASGLFPVGGGPDSQSVFSVVGDNGLVFDTFEQSQELREVNLATGATLQLTRSLARDRQPAYSPDGRFIVFSSNRTGNLDLWLLDRASGEQRQLTDDAAQDWDPGFSADGRQVLFSSSRGGHLEIWTVDVDGSSARQVSNDGVNAENPTMTPDGHWVVYSSGNSEHVGVFRIRPDGSEAARITQGNHTTPDVSPDGRWAMFIALGGSVKVQFVEIETGRLAATAMDLGPGTRATSITLGRGRWTRQGAGVAFTGIDEDGHTGIFEQDFDPDHDTTATRRPLAGFYDDVQTESFGIAPGGEWVTLSVIRETRSLMLAEGVPSGDR